MLAWWFRSDDVCNYCLEEEDGGDDVVITDAGLVVQEVKMCVIITYSTRG